MENLVTQEDFFEDRRKNKRENPEYAKLTGHQERRALDENFDARPWYLKINYVNKSLQSK